MKQIREWLEGEVRDYAAGVALFEAHGRSGVLKRLLAGACTDYTREVLARELAKLASECHANTSAVSTNVLEKAPAAPAELAKLASECHANTSAVSTNVLEKAPAAPAVALQSPINPQEPTAEADELRRQRRKLFADRDYLHASLELLPTEAGRLEASLQLLAVVKRIQLSYDVEAGRVADPEPAPGPDLAALTDAGEVRRLLANLKPLRSKLKKRPDRADKLAEVEADIHLLETKLKPT